MTQKVASPTFDGCEFVFKRPGSSIANDKIHECHPNVPFVFFAVARMAEEVNFYAPSILESTSVGY
jgi:hypothetical protein